MFLCSKSQDTSCCSCSLVPVKDVYKRQIQHSGSVYLLADHTKADVTALMTYCPLDQVDTLITDAQLDDKYHRFFAASGGAVVVAT